MPGIATPDQAASLGPSWPQLASFFATLEEDEDLDLIADCGRLCAPHAPWPLLRRADLTLVVVRPVLSSLLPARALVEALLADTEREGRLGLLVIGYGDYDDRTIAAHLDATVVARLPWDERSARVLARGGTLRTRQPLLRAAASTMLRGADRAGV